MIDFGDIWEAFQVLAKSGGLGVIHAEDNDIVMHMYAKLIREGRVGFEHLAEVHNRLSEDLSFRRVLRLAESVPGTALYMMHVSAATGVAAIAEARRKGLPVSGPTLHRYPRCSARVSGNAARIMGRYPRKGAIAAGSDADITILDPTRRGRITAADLHETDYTPWEGHDIFAWPVMTMLRGKVMVENGEYLASRGDG